MSSFVSSSHIATPEVTTAFKMAAAAMLEIQVNAIKWVITIRF
jgi:hypothetical protein